MEQAPKRRLIIRKKLVPNEGDESSNCTFNPITDTPKKCPCGGYYTSDSEYTPRECCSGLYTHGVRYKWFDGRYTPDYTPVEVVDEKQKFYSGFDKPVIYDFTGDKFISTTAKTPAKETTSGFNIIPASQLRETQRGDKRDYREDSRNTSRYSREDKRDWREDTRDSRNTSRYSREDSRNTSRYSREDKRDWREDTRDSRDSRNTSRYSREDTRDTGNDRDYHRGRERDYARNTRVTDEPNRYNGARREPSKFKSDLDSELGKYGRKF